MPSDSIATHRDCATSGHLYARDREWHRCTACGHRSLHADHSAAIVAAPAAAPTQREEWAIQIRDDLMDNWGPWGKWDDRECAVEDIRQLQRHHPALTFRLVRRRIEEEVVEGPTDV